MADEAAPHGASMARVGFRLGLIGVVGGRLRYGGALGAVPRIRVVGIADPEMRAAQAWSKTLPLRPPAYSSLSAMLEAGLDLEGLVLSSPLPLRSAALTAALEIGLPVITEFPLSANHVEEAEIVAAFEARNLVLMPTLPRRFDPDFVQMLQSMEAGSIGVLRQARCDWSLPSGDSEEKKTGVESESYGWRTLLELAARQAIDVGRWWFGEAVSVSADIGPEQGAIAVRTSATAKALSNPVATIIVTHDKGQFTHRFALSRSLQASERYTVLGSLGHLELATTSGNATHSSVSTVTLHRIGRASARLRPQDTGGVTKGLSGMLTHFTECAIAGSTPRVVIEDALAASEIFEAAVRSSTDRCRISLPLLRR